MSKRPMSGTTTDVDLVGVDFGVWLRAPNPVELDPDGPDEQTWAASHTEAVWHGADPDPDQRERTRSLLALVADRRVPPWAETGWAAKLVHLPDPTDMPLPVLVGYLPVHDPDPLDPDAVDAALRALVRVGDPACVEPPVVEPVTTPLGAGLRGIAYTRAATGDPAGTTGVELLATISYAWRVPDVDGSPMDVRLWTTWEPARVIAAADDLARLADCLRLVEVPA